MLSRLAGRLITSPLAFLVAGLIDAAGFWLSWARESVRRRF
jgi:hypothetical protein